LFARLETVIGDIWGRAREGRFWNHVLENGFDRSLYRLVMVQIYHYTRHNSINQAVAAFGAVPEQIGLLRFAYTHAREELGHENMVLHDLRAVGLLSPSETITYCAYKGRATYWSPMVDSPTGTDFGWSYEDPLHDAADVAGRIAFFTERADLFVDDQAVERPITPWSKR